MRDIDSFRAGLAILIIATLASPAAFLVFFALSRPGLILLTLVAAAVATVTAGFLMYRGHGEPLLIMLPCLTIGSIVFSGGHLFFIGAILLITSQMWLNTFLAQVAENPKTGSTLAISTTLLVAAYFLKEELPGLTFTAVFLFHVVSSACFIHHHSKLAHLK